MSNFAEFLTKIQLLEDNIIMPITAAGTGANENQNLFKDFDPSNFMTNFDLSMFSTTIDGQTSSQFHAPSIQTTSDLSVYLNAITPNETTIDSRPRKFFPLTPSVPLPFFKDSAAGPPPQIAPAESSQVINLVPGAQPTIAMALKTAEPGATIFLAPGYYEGGCVIRQDVTIRADRSAPAYIDAKDTAFYIEDGSVYFEGIGIRAGQFEVAGNAKVQLTYVTFGTPLKVRGEATVSVRESRFMVQSGYGAIVDENGSLRIFATQFDAFGLNIKGGNLVVSGSKIESIKGNCLFAEGGTVLFEEVSLGDSNQSVVKCINKSNVTLTNCNIYDASNDNLVTASRGATLRIKGGVLSGQCNAAVVSSNGASVSVENIEIAKPVIANNRSLLRLIRCRPIVLLVYNSNAILSECQIVAAPRTGLVSVGTSDLQIESTIFSNCTANGLELSEDTTATIVGSQFSQNQIAGVVVSSFSATFRNCVFDGNNFVGCQISGLNASPLFDNCTFINNAVAGITSLETTSPSFLNCQFKQNDRYGAILVKSRATFTNSEFSINQGIGLEIKNGSRPQLTNCVFDSNSNFAAQISGQGTNVHFTQCSFSKHLRSSTAIIYSKSFAFFGQCLFTTSGPCHLEVREEGKARIEQCVLSESQGGVGIYVHNTGVLEVDNCSLKDEKKTAIYVGNRGQAAIVGSEIIGCGKAGIFTDLQSSVVIMKNLIKGNGSVGVHAEGGEVRIDGNQFEAHNDFGIYSTNVSQIVQENNIFSQNLKGDTQIA